MKPQLPSIDAHDLVTVSGGLLGPLDIILAPFQASDEYSRACAQARHWESNARQPGATDGEKAYASYKRQFCPTRWYAPLTW